MVTTRHRLRENLKKCSWVEMDNVDRLEGHAADYGQAPIYYILAEIDPLLIDVMADEKPPDGFCRDENDDLICAKCNTAAGCVRPLLDQFKIDLKDQLFDSEDLWEPKALRKWVKNALGNQQCVWGKHKPVARIDIRPFQAGSTRMRTGALCHMTPQSML